ncbi:MAG TPA: flagellar basal-body MS-ring/collar protein FliF [Rugosimonospora sp.]|nr:flagellar basal-body MS-ring/collar protein FliF [Rugosimonospora sp.]
MRDRVTQSARRLTTTFGSFTPGQKAVTILGVLVLAVGGYLFSTWAAQPTYAPLFANLSGADASAIVDKLTSAGTPYKLADGGTTILVPQSQVYDTRIKMSGQGLPAQSDTGYSLLDKQGLTTSEFMQNVDYQRALEGELAKTIKSIDGVNNATVHLAIPQKDIFADDQQKPTASVLIVPASGRTPTQDQVQSIVHLVAASVVGLDPSQVTVASADGTVLSTGDGQALSAATGLRQQQTSDFEHRMNTAIEQMLATVVGPGHVVVRTTADLDYDETQTKTQTYLAPSPSTPPLSQTNNTETYTGTGGNNGGVLGPGNIQVPNGVAGSGTYSHSSNTQDNAVGLVTETRNSAPGNLLKLSVAVLLDSTTAKNVNLTQIQSLVSSAVALTPSRGDTIAIGSMPFDQTTANDARKATQDANKASAQDQLMSMIKTGVMVLAILALLFLAWRASRRSKRTSLSDEEMAQIERIQASIETRRGGAAAIAGDSKTPALESRPAAPEERPDYRAGISTLVERQPDNVAQVLRDWLAESRRG